MTEEIWKQIPGYEGRYQASTFGQIRSVDRSITQIGRWGKPVTRNLRGKILRPGTSNSGHLSVVLGHGEHGSQVHQLVLLTFKGPCPHGLEIRHLNGIPSDNFLENIIYGTRRENILDVYAIGKAWRILTAEKALEIRSAINSGEKISLIAKRFNVSLDIVYKMRSGVTYSWLL